MGRHLAVAASVGAAAGATVSVLAFIAVTFGADAYYWVVSWRETKRATRSTA